MSSLKQFIEHKAYNMRVSSLRMTTQAGSGHPTSALSSAEIVATLFFYVMQFDPHDPNNVNNDRFILSKGHGSPILYAVWKELGILTDDELMTYRDFDSILEGHPTPRFSRSEAATGSLGQGLSIGLGMSLAAHLGHHTYRTYVLLGDSECTEGSVWEAAEIAAYYRCNNLIAIIDENRLGQTTQTIHGYNSKAYEEKFTAFGWKTFAVDGHDVQAVMDCFDQAKRVQGQPVMIVAKTVKGYGVKKAEDQLGFHGKAFRREQLPVILEQVREEFAAAARPVEYRWEAQLPSPARPTQQPKQKAALPQPSFKHGEEIMTRKVYGQALAVLGDVDVDVVSLDAEVKNSTFAEIFETAHPARFFQCFIAEQNMIGMAVGIAARGFIPFASTFACFLTRAFDQIRMAAIGRSPLRLCGSHAGVSIGQDGPSQMGLEDIAMLRAVPGSVILYPCDAVSTYRCVELMHNYGAGISYLRTTRMATPVIYENDEQFKIGGCKIVRQSEHDTACIIAAGITLHEALKAYKELRRQNISVAVIDLYGIKPVDCATILKVAQCAQNRVITVEDHYLEGGLGQAVAYALRSTEITIDCLAVTKIPRSGTPEQLLAFAEINAQAIEKAVKKSIKDAHEAK